MKGSQQRKGVFSMKAFRRKSSYLSALIIGVLALLISAGAARSENFWTTLKKGERKKQVVITNQTFSGLAEKLKPAVVNISTTMVVKGQPFFGGRPSMPRERETRSLGSGVIINKEGYIVTNNHVVENAKEIIVTLHNEKDFKAEVIGKDKKTDLALIKIEAEGDLPVAPLGDSDKLGVGEWVLAIGNPFGLAETVTTGIVSAKGRVIGAGPYDDFIQTDASINPGNSGGPLFNFWGEVVGINTAIIATGQGIGFAIPINMAKELLPQLKEKGRVTRGWLGVVIQRVTSQLAESFGLKEKKGALVSDVFKGGPAEEAGVQRGDIILEFNGKEIKDFGDLSRTVASTPVGSNVSIKVFRNGKILSLQATIAEMEEPKEVAKAPGRKSLGITVQNITPEIARSLGLELGSGVVITGVEPGSPAAKAGIRSGDVIQEINREPIKDADEFNRAIESAKDQENTLFLIRRGESNLFIVVTRE
jgi:serine protease Do